MFASRRTEAGPGIGWSIATAQLRLERARPRVARAWHPANSLAGVDCRTPPWSSAVHGLIGPRSPLVVPFGRSLAGLWRGRHAALRSAALGRPPLPSAPVAHPRLCHLAATAQHIVRRGSLPGWGLAFGSPVPVQTPSGVPKCSGTCRAPEDLGTRTHRARPLCFAGQVDKYKELRGLANLRGRRPTNTPRDAVAYEAGGESILGREVQRDGGEARMPAQTTRSAKGRRAQKGRGTPTAKAEIATREKVFGCSSLR